MPSSGQFRFLSEPRAAARRALARWARARQGPDDTPLTLRPRRIYIVPTRSGIIAAVLLFLMLLAGLNYNNSLALMLCFMLSGVLLVSMYECHRTLAGLVIERAAVEPAFAGTDGELQLQVLNEDRRARAGLRCVCAPCSPTNQSLAPGSGALLRLRYQARTRGRQRIERLELSTRAPLGMFHAWTWLHLPLEAIVYPAPLAGYALPPPRGAARGTRDARRRGEEEWAWLRPFRDGDPPRSVAWKAYARGAALLVAHYDAPAGGRRVLDFNSAPALPLEQRLSVLTAWVLECERLGEHYALALPDADVPEGHGLAHRHSCLRALALYGA